MLAAIDFDDDFVFLAHEVEEITIDRRLPAKVITLAAPSPEPHPELHFLRCHLFAKRASETDTIVHGWASSGCARTRSWGKSFRTMHETSLRRAKRREGGRPPGRTGGVSPPGHCSRI